MPRGNIHFLGLAVDLLQNDRTSRSNLNPRAIKENAGLTLVQEPASVEAESMPQGAIQAGVADIIAPPEAWPAKIAEYLRHPSCALEFEPPAVEVVSALDKIVIRAQSNVRAEKLKQPLALQQIRGQGSVFPQPRPLAGQRSSFSGRPAIQTERHGLAPLGKLEPWPRQTNPRPQCTGRHLALHRTRSHMH
ncbi:MAG: hypothetical protein IV101_12885 [Dechloromonas sp.]|nr:hypothetical protein [Dechloromonas sp.]